MTLKEHKKHTDLVRPYGNFGRNEWAIIGGQCAEIKILAGKVFDQLSANFKCAYADAVHDDETSTLPGRLGNGAAIEYTDHINYHRFQYRQDFNTYGFRTQFAEADLVLVNGNHHEARAQIVVIDETKKASLQKRVGRLKNVQLILLRDRATAVFDFIKDAVPNWQSLPVFAMDDTKQIIRFFEQRLEAARPPLYGLVLAGGKSERMGFDKGSADYHGKPQRYFVADLLEKHCTSVYISCRPDQQSAIAPGYQSLPDTFTGLGPFGAILSALREKPDAAWLVLACDLLLMDEETLQQLVDGRQPMDMATAFNSPENEFPEPLITIWEPKSYPVLLSFLAQGYSCPRKVLINSDVRLLSAIHPEALTNVNTPEELEKAKIRLQTHQSAS